MSSAVRCRSRRDRYEHPGREDLLEDRGCEVSHAVHEQSILWVEGHVRMRKVRLSSGCSRWLGWLLCLLLGGLLCLLLGLSLLWLRPKTNEAHELLEARQWWMIVTVLLSMRSGRGCRLSLRNGHRCWLSLSLSLSLSMWLRRRLRLLGLCIRAVVLLASAKPEHVREQVAQAASGSSVRLLWCTAMYTER